MGRSSTKKGGDRTRKSFARNRGVYIVKQPMLQGSIICKRVSKGKTVITAYRFLLGTGSKKGKRFIGGRRTGSCNEQGKEER